MSEPSHNEQEVIRYLIGALPEAETERFDALSIADPNFADQLAATENDLVDAYNQGELTGDTLARFERHYLSSPLRRKKVEFGKALQKHAERSAVQAPAEALKESTSKLGTAGSFWPSLFKGEGLMLRWSLAAAAVILLAAGGWWTFHNRSQAIVSVVLAPPVRGSDQLVTVSIAERTTQLEAQLELESDNFPTYRVLLMDESGTTELWRSDSLTATGTSETKHLSVRLPARLLKSEVYSLFVSGIDPAGKIELIGNYPFRAQVE